MFEYCTGLTLVLTAPVIFTQTLMQFKNNFFVALDTGCGPGRTALELCSVFDHVEAYDYSQGFVDMMINEMKKRELGNLVAFQVLISFIHFVAIEL